MRILKVSFKNINSLAGDWTIDFTHRDYSDFGVFLIAGPTGSGKTTILDAITLALYGCTPRIDPTGKTCEIMTRDTKDCRAEVIFETEAGRFRSYWGRDTKKDGSFNAPKREFENLDTRELATKVKDIESLKQANKIMDYNQFVRSVLLAQGDFQKFLNSDDKEKSAILENLTGSEIYTELSILAFDKEKEERKQKEILQDKYDNIPVLNNEEIAGKKDQVIKCDAEIVNLDKELKDCQIKIQWLEKLNSLKAEVKKLEAAQRNISLRKEEFEAKDKILQAGKQARDFEPYFTRLEYIRGQYEDRKNKLEEAKNRLKILSEALKECVLKNSLAVQREENCAKDLEDARPLFEQARLLDQNISEKQQELKKNEALLREARDRYKDLLSEQAALESRQEEDKRGLSEIVSWLESHKGDAWLIENRNEVKSRIRILESLAQDAREAGLKISRQERELENIERQIGEKQEALAKKDAERSNIRADIGDIEERRKSNLGGGTLEDLESELVNRQMELAEANKFISMEEHRKTLAPGQPCPLCGALDHPYIEGHPRPDINLRQEACNNLEKKIKQIKLDNEEIGKFERMDAEARHAWEIINTENMVLERSREERLAIIREERKQLEVKNGEIGKQEEGIRADLENIGMNALDSLDSMDEIGQILDKRAEEWQKMVKAREDREKALADLKPKLSVCQANIKNCEEALSQREKQSAGIGESLEDLRQKRALLFDGRDAKEEEEKLKKALAEAHQSSLEAQREEGAISVNYNQESGQVLAQEDNLKKLAPELASQEKEFADVLDKRGWNEERFIKSRLDMEVINRLEAEKKALEKDEAEIGLLLGENLAKLKDEEDRNLTDKNLTELDQEVSGIRDRRENYQEAKAELKSELNENEKKIAEKEKLKVEVERQTVTWGKWKELYDLIGSSDGKKFRNFAQSITLDILLNYANQQLVKIRDRYLLQRAEKADSSFLGIEVIDRYLGDKRRPVKNLSGGETFIVSLALALGLANMAGKQSAPGSLFLDEGFGSLDEETLKTAIDTITDLSNEEGKLIGIISHVEALRNRNAIPAHITVEPDGKGMSRLKGPGVSRGKNA